ncbi:MAG: FliH/SctL family protein [Pseudomonadota bacterium]
MTVSEDTQVLDPFRQSHQEGYRVGLAEARDQLEEGFRGQWQEQVERLRHSIERLHVLEQILQAETRESVMDLAVRLARRLLEREITTQPSTLLDLTRTVVREARGSSALTIHLHPEDLALLEEFEQELALASEGATHITLQPDPALQRGDCLIAAGGGQLDGRLAARLEALRRGLASSVSTPRGDKPTS